MKICSQQPVNGCGRDNSIRGESKMKIAITATGPDLGARVADRLGTAPYLLVVDLDDMSFEAVDGPPPSAGHGAGVETLSTAMDMGAKVILTGFLSPHIALALEKIGIGVITSVSGSAMDAIERYRQGVSGQASSPSQESDPVGDAHGRMRFYEAFQRAGRQFSGIVPVLVGVVLLVGLFRGFVSRDMLLSVFSGNMISDTFRGACMGSLLSGNPVNSYVIGDTLLTMGVSLFGATALMLAWVNVGVLQLPAEISALGARFAVIRAMAAFCMAIGGSILTVVLTGGRLG